GSSLPRPRRQGQDRQQGRRRDHRRPAVGPPAPVALPAKHPDRASDKGRPDRRRPVPGHPGHAVRRLLVAAVRARPGEQEAAAEDAMTLAIAKAAALFFFVTVIQVTIVSSIGILGGSPDLVLVTLVAVALTQGSIFGAASGFWAG